MAIGAYRMRVGGITAGAIIVIAVLFFAYSNFNRYRVLLFGQETSAKVTDLIEVHGLAGQRAGGSTYVHYEYSVSGQKYQGRTEFDGVSLESSGALKEGDEVEVKYLPGNPERSVLSSDADLQSAHLTFVVLITSLLFLLPGVYFIARRKLSAQHSGSRTSTKLIAILALTVPFAVLVIWQVQQAIIYPLVGIPVLIIAILGALFVAGLLIAIKRGKITAQPYVKDGGLQYRFVKKK